MTNEIPLWRERLGWFWDGENLERLTENFQKQWDALTKPVPQHILQAIDLTTNLSVCNWNLTPQVQALLRLIVSGEHPTMPFGHRHSVTQARWDQVWAYYLSLRTWQPKSWRSGYPHMLNKVDPDGEIKQHVFDMLGESTPLKQLYVERLCLAMEWSGIGSLFDKQTGDDGKALSAQGIAHNAAVQAVEAEIKIQTPDSDILPWLELDGEGQLEPCHHKLFRRYDILISSIGANQWRGAIPEQRSGGFARAHEIHPYLDTLRSHIDDEAGDAAQRFAFAYLHGILTSFHQRAITKAEQRTRA